MGEAVENLQDNLQEIDKEEEKEKRNYDKISFKRFDC